MILMFIEFLVQQLESLKELLNSISITMITEVLVAAKGS